MLERSITQRLKEVLTYSRIVFLSGPRQSGKSTLVRTFIAKDYPATYVTLDDVNARTFAQNDPVGFLAQQPKPVAIDEIQRAPDLLLEMKRIVDLDPQPGQFLLTGSTDLSTIKPAFDSLAGRITEIELLPFSQSEIHGNSSNIIDLLMQSEHSLKNLPYGQVNRNDIWRFLTTGGYPEPVHSKTDHARQHWFSAYTTSMMQRDLPELGAVRHSQVFPKLLRLCASRSCGLLNISDLARTLQLPRASVDRYLQLLEALFLIKRLPTWHHNTGQRLVKTPKLYLVDSGLHAYLGRFSQKKAESNPTILGPLFETFIYNELRKHTAWAMARTELYHWRTSGGREVDFILESEEGMVTAVEVKAAATIHRKDISSLQALQTALGNTFQQGFIFYSGSQIFPVAKKIFALPVATLWQKEVI